MQLGGLLFIIVPPCILDGELSVVHMQVTADIMSFAVDVEMLSVKKTKQKKNLN